MVLADYTSYDEIRSLLGVTRRELADSTLALPHWALITEQELRDMDGGVGVVLTQYTTVAALSTKTADQTQFYNVARLFVLYSIGRQLLRSADVFQPLSISDGKAALARLESRFDTLRPAIDGGWQALKARVEAALAILVPAATLKVSVDRVMIIGSGLGTDPVTGV